MSDSVSLSSNVSGDISMPGGIVVEEVGQISLGDFVPKRMVLLDHTFASINDENRLLLGELRSRAGDEWILAAKSVQNIIEKTKATDERRYLDLALVPNSRFGTGGISIVFLVEKKNKERFITAHGIKHGKHIALDEEYSVYDKVNVLGKGTTHIAADILNTEVPTIYSVSNLLRKLRIEDGGLNLKPTTARAPVPTEGQDGTLAMAVQPESAKASSKSSQALVVLSFKTKSASKNKYMIEWYQSKRDELSCLKCPVKLPETSEPFVLLADPKDTRSVYAMCVNRNSNCTNLHKLTKGRKHEEPLATLNFPTDLAAIGTSPDLSNSVIVMAYNQSKEMAKLFTIQKTEGFRARHPVCANCSSLESLGSPCHVLSCASHKWQFPAGIVDKHIVNEAVPVALVTLLESPHGGRYVCEPDSGLPYRLRVVGCDTQGFGPIPIIMEDLERVFENAEDKLSSAILKICLNHPPCKDAISLISSWTSPGRLGQVELHYVAQESGSNRRSIETGSDKFMIKPISADRFRGFVTDVDWTQMNQRQGTFTLDTPSDSAGKSRTPRMNKNERTDNMNGSFNLTPEMDESDHANSRINLGNLARGLAECLEKLQRDEASLNDNILSLTEKMKSLSALTDNELE